MRTILFLLSVLVSQTVWAQTGSVPHFNPKGVQGRVGAGFAGFTVKNPTNPDRFRLDQGIYAQIGGEKGFGFLNWYLTFSFGYLQTKGLADYDYSTLSGERYRTNDANFRVDVFQASLGLRMKLIDGYFMRPYVEGGGTLGYYTLTYDFNTVNKAALNATGTNFKSSDSILDLGHYLEGGAELEFSKSFGLVAAFRLIRSETKEVETLRRQKIQYESQIYYLGICKFF